MPRVVLWEGELVLANAGLAAPWCVQDWWWLEHTAEGSLCGTAVWGEVPVLSTCEGGFAGCRGASWWRLMMFIYYVH